MSEKELKGKAADVKYYSNCLEKVDNECNQIEAKLEKVIEEKSR